jgi:hypothetical protein
VAAVANPSASRVAFASHTQRFHAASARGRCHVDTCLGDTATLEAMASPWPPRASTPELPDVVDRLVDADKRRDYLRGNAVATDHCAMYRSRP